MTKDINLRIFFGDSEVSIFLTIHAVEDLGDGR